MKDWDGVGLPPIGYECEQLYDDVWLVGTVVAHFKGWGIFFVDEDRIAAYAGGFRKVGHEEREEAIAELVKVTCISHGEAARIYDAGYRKMVE